jgi:hypothetical protein
LARPRIGIVRRATKHQHVRARFARVKHNSNGGFAKRRIAFGKRTALARENAGQLLDERRGVQLSTAPPAATQPFQPGAIDTTSLYPIS